MEALLRKSTLKVANILKKFKRYLFNKTKTKKPIKTLDNAFVVKDMTEVGALNQIPIWLFGFLY